MKTTTQKSSRISRLQQEYKSDIFYGKLPPQAKDLERAVLGALLIDKNAYNTISSMLPPEALYDGINRKVYQAIQALAGSGRPIDILTVCEQLKSQNDLDNVGGNYYVTALTNDVVSSAHIVHHCRIILQKFLQRELIRISSDTIAEGYMDSTDAFELLYRVSSSINSLMLGTYKSDYKNITDIMARSIKNIESLRHREQQLTGITSGFIDLDMVTCGWQPTDLIILAARPSVGKTAIALNLLKNASQGIPVGMFSLEMSDQQLINRILSAQSGIWLHKIRNASLNDADMKQLYTDGCRPLSRNNIFIDDTPALKISDLKAKAKKMADKDGVKLIVVDYLQLLRSDQKYERKDLEIAYFTSELKAIAKELKIPIIVLSQLSREVEKRANNEPRLSDLRESGAIEQDADLIVFLWRPTEAEIREDGSLSNLCHLKIDKHRNGALASFIGEFNSGIQKWETISIVDGESLKPISNTWKPVKEA